MRLTPYMLCFCVISIADKSVFPARAIKNINTRTP